MVCFDNDMFCNKYSIFCSRTIWFVSRMICFVTNTFEGVPAGTLEMMLGHGIDAGACLEARAKPPFVMRVMPGGSQA